MRRSTLKIEYADDLDTASTCTSSFPSQTVVVTNPVSANAPGGVQHAVLLRVQDGVAAERTAAAAPGPTRSNEEVQALADLIDGLDLDAAGRALKQLRHTRAVLGGAGAGGVDAVRARGVLSDYCATQHRVLEQAVAAMGQVEQPLPHLLAKRRRQLRWGEWVDSALEVTNLGFDLWFTAKDLWVHAVLFASSVAFLAASLLLRLWFGLQERVRVDWANHRWRYARGLLLSLVEPFEGMRLIKRSFQQGGTSGAQRWDTTLNKYVNDDRDPLAVQAENDAAAVRAETKTCVTLVLVEDVPGFAIQLVFTLLHSQGGGGAAALLNDPLLLLTVLTTLVHAAKQLSEAWQLGWRELPQLEREDAARDKAFPESAGDGDIVEFAKGAGAEHARKRCPGITIIDLEGCTNITDAAVEALAQRCPGITRIVLSGCTNITDAAVEALAQRCPGITIIGLNGCTNTTDAAVEALAQRCPGITIIGLNGCTNITDAAVEALAQRCPGITIIDLEGCTNITDAAVEALAQRCPGITRIVLSGCTNITDAAVEALAQRCPGITIKRGAGASGGGVSMM
eukprot:g4759.t1